jgi:hypothetical protein
LRIQYVEIYDEIKDHYLSELEKKSANEFEATFQQLNEAFAWSVVKKMEKNLERSTDQIITHLQWAELKFWKLNSKSQLYPLLMMLVLGVVYRFLDVEGMTLTVAVIALVSIPIIWYSIWTEISFSPRRFNFKSAKAFPNQIVNRIGICFSGLSLFYVAINNWNDSNPGVTGTIMIWLITAPATLYILSLIQVALAWKERQQRAISQ